VWPEPLILTEVHAGQTVAAVLRPLLAGQSWKQIRQLIANRQVTLAGQVCTDPARRVKLGETLAVSAKGAPLPKAATAPGLAIRHLDADVVVVEKASGLNTVRHPAEREWTDQRKAQSPTLEDLTAVAIARQLGLAGRHQLPRLRIVHRLDKETSGLVVFARTPAAEVALGRQFKAHTVIRRYHALIAGHLPAKTISTWLIRDRGDGRRGSGPDGQGKRAVTHLTPLERVGAYTLMECRLETGRTHQIRIHLAEMGHPVCGEPVYRIQRNQTVLPDASGAPRLALHAAELGFAHPTTQQAVHWHMPLPPDLQRLLERLRTQG
jgi:23S rRNA pseudouridine1911/1915/1917 synthase